MKDNKGRGGGGAHIYSSENDHKMGCSSCGYSTNIRRRSYQNHTWSGPAPHRAWLPAESYALIRHCTGTVNINRRVLRRVCNPSRSAWKLHGYIPLRCVSATVTALAHPHDKMIYNKIKRKNVKQFTLL